MVILEAVNYTVLECKLSFWCRTIVKKTGSTGSLCRPTVQRIIDQSSQVKYSQQFLLFKTVLHKGDEKVCIAKFANFRLKMCPTSDISQINVAKKS